MSNTSNDAALDYLKELKKDKISIITETKEYKHFKLNGVEYVELLEDSTAWSVFYDVISATLGSHFLNERNIYPVSRMATLYKKMIERARRRFTHFEKQTNFKDTVAIFELLRIASDRVEEERKSRMDDGLVIFEDLPFLFEDGERVTWENSDELQVAGYYRAAEAKSSWSGSYMIFTMEVIVKVSNSVTRAQVTLSVPAFGGSVEISKLPIAKLVTGSKTEKELIARGEIFASVAGGASYVEYTGMLVKPGWMSDAEFRADGRVMVDPESMARLDSTTYDKVKRRIMQKTGYRDDDDIEVKIETVDEKDLFACSPYVLGFSFRAKTWGMLRIADIKPIDWAKDAFERLVLEPKTKKRVRALVQNSTDSFSDIIGGKGGGCVFLLHGEPGQGKTLTAETVAEDLRRPLYSISVGELGTDPDQLEKRLREILDLATIWNAVLLLDEADIFLEARDEKDVLRNAMVGVFLRLLEYHQGVLFLTTNRVRNIDTAFYSRISVAIAFTKADASKRFKVWNNLLGAAGLKLGDNEIGELAKSDLNGRQIKNVIRTATTLAKLDGETVTFERLQDEIDEATRFERDMREAPEFLTKEPAKPQLVKAA
ncbi:ATPase family associated with various cellular activities (AAA) [Rhizobium sp. AN5]|uniref:ATP-binding protein n=1 Tax=Rhizobium sp. AN5 TaxID=1855304 RepID=UPI000BC67FB9|nr:ATP-binding protein [Rhizobium sp. AN5]SOC90039.1 ATPase family associated with various cellular activities (AAA) [Rhizobium sp. AN5]